MSQKIIVYSTDWCGYCAAEKEWLKHNNIEFIEKNIEQDAEAHAEFIEKMGGPSGIPVTDIDGEIVVGFDREKLRKLLGISKF